MEGLSETIKAAKKSLKRLREPEDNKKSELAKMIYNELKEGIEDAGENSDGESDIVIGLENQIFTEEMIIHVTSNITRELEKEGITLLFSWSKKEVKEVIFCDIKIC